MLWLSLVLSVRFKLTIPSAGPSSKQSDAQYYVVITFDVQQNHHVKKVVITSLDGTEQPQFQPALSKALADPAAPMEHVWRALGTVINKQHQQSRWKSS